MSAGDYGLTVEGPNYRALGMLLGDTTVSVGDVGRIEVAFQAPSTTAIRRALCGDNSGETSSALVRVTLVDRATLRILTGAKIRMAWVSTATVNRAGRTTLEARDRSVDIVTADDGSAVFCDVPAKIPLVVGYPTSDATLVPIFQFTTKPGEIVARALSVPPPPQ